MNISKIIKNKLENIQLKDESGLGLPALEWNGIDRFVIFSVNNFCENGRLQLEILDTLLEV